MPLHVTDFTWTQTESTVHIKVPLKGAKAGSVDIVSTEEYLKLHFPPFLFEAFLFEPVDDDRSTAKVGNGVAVFTLPKKTAKMWEHLMMTTDDKETKRGIRERALLKQQEKLSAESKQKAEKRQAERKYALETMMKLETEEKERIQKMKDAEREQMTAELAAWQMKRKQEAEKAQKNQNHQIQPRGSTDTAEHRLMEVQKNKDVHSTTKNQKIQTRLPPPRPRGNIPVTFTPRVFPTALRESLVSEEEEWLKKQAEARRAVNAEPEELQDLTEEERNPDWLKQKGDKCFTNGDYVGAVKAYSLGIRLNGSIPALYSNRAACHLKLRNLHKAIEDSSKALDLLTPAVPANAAARVRASVRRGTAFCQLELYAEGLQDYEAALKIDPHNTGLQEDAQMIRSIIQGSAGQVKLWSNET
ncbi:PREDICTED: dyslexia susceptibility 1 candidate gene 1 protein [Cyprinodon variegatus]|uniref:dyslexia susceptibility 1 candidate gene 1 protein n=1 Tax=Cyprinodon variegatus TaxID=28743 RepID=UPI0007427FF7|nr:PREDICTED: dyslexia susceptibility 1 candidate gene 1 protein [Cyprinodon variegatus]